MSSLSSFFMSGYTIGNSTVFKNIKSVEAGSFLEIRGSKFFNKTKYYTFEPWKYKKKQKLNTIQNKYHKCNLDVFKKIIKYCEKRNLGLAVSLTAGNSRLTVAMLKKLKFNNFICFTYVLKIIMKKRLQKKYLIF